MKRKILSLLAALGLSTVLLIGLSAPAEACTASGGVYQGGSLLHHSSSMRSTLYVSLGWTASNTGGPPYYSIPRGWHSDNYIAGSDCGSQNDVDGFYNYANYDTFYRGYEGGQLTWINGWGSTGWHKITDFQNLTVMQVYCPSSTWC